MAISDNLTWLRQQLAEIDAARDGAISAAAAESAARLSAMATAGNEYDEQVAAREAEYQDAQTSYDDMLSVTSQRLDDAKGSIALIETEPVSLEDVTPLPIDTGGTPDCAAVDIQKVIDDFALQVNARFAQLEDAYNNGNAAAIKDGMAAQQDVAQAFRDQMPSSADNEAQKAQFYSTLEGLY